MYMPITSSFLKRSILRSFVITLAVLLFSSTSLFADKQSDSERLYMLQKELENSDFSGNDSTANLIVIKLKSSLDKFVNDYKPNKQYVRSITYLAKHLANKNQRESIRLLHQANLICEDMQYDTLNAFVSHDLASIYFQKGLVAEAYNLFIESAEYFKQIEDMPAYAYTLIDVGNVYYREQQWTLAVDYYQKAEPVFKNVEKESDRVWGLSVVYDNIGQVYGQMGNFDTALVFYRKAFEIRKNAKLKNQYYNTYISVADMFAGNNQFDSAIVYSEKAIAICKETRQENELAFCYYAYAEILFNVDTVKALSVLHKSLNLTKGKSVSFLLRIYHKFVKYYHKNNIDSTLFYAEQMYHKSMEFDNQYYSTLAIKYLVDIYPKFDEKAKEVQFLRLYVARLKEMNNKDLYKAELKFEEQKWEQDREQFRVEKKQDKMIGNFKTALVIIVTIFSFFLILGSVKLKRTAKKLQESNRQLQESIRNKDMIYSIVAHDLRGPVGSSLGLIKLMDEDYMDADSFNEVLPTIRKSMEGTYYLLENLLSWAQLNKNEIQLNIEQFDIRNSTKAVVRTLESSANAKNIEVNNLIDQNIIVFADQHSISTVIRNLVSNAIKFTNQDGKINITAKIIGQEVRVCVKDTGIGMNQKMIEKLFSDDQMLTNPGTNNEKGSGLGLKLCQAFVKMNNGKIWVESTEGVGSSFFFTLSMS